METLEGKLTSLEIAVKLREQADVLQKYIDAKLNPAISRQRPTARRMRIYNGMREDVLKMERIQTILRALADAHETNRILHFPHLEDIRNKKQIQTLLLIEPIERYNWDIERYVESESDSLERMSIFSGYDWRNAYKQLQDLLGSSNDRSEERQTETKIRELEMDLLSRKIPGFFPTPKELIERMIEMAEINNGDAVLDPSAGKGDILDVVREKFGKKVSRGGFEINSTLRQLLELKKHPVHGSDFFEFKEEKFDKILMNPPFENGVDIDHVMHAYSVLNPGGRMVAIMSEGVFFRQYKKEKQFREWLHEHDALISEPLKEAFKKGFKATGITVRLVSIDKPQLIMKSNILNEETELKLLELEAIAELELLRMEMNGRNNLEGNEKPVSKPYRIFSEELITQEENEVKKVKKEKPVPEIKLSYFSDASLPNVKIKQSQDAEQFLRGVYENDTIELQEQFIVLYLNRANRIIGYNRHSKGGLTGTVADLRIIFSAALKSLATGILVSHNHPSGNLNPSDADIRLTNRIKETGNIIEIPLLDHIILTKEGFYSFTDNGLI